MVLVLGVIGILATLATAQPPANAPLEEAEKKIAALQYREAVKPLALAREVRGNSHATTVRILALSGLVAASLGDKAAAVAAFRELVVIEPKFQADPGWSPKVRSPYHEAKGWSDEHGTLEVVDLPPRIEHGQVRALEVRLARDPLRLVTAVRVHLVGDATSLSATLTSAVNLARIPVPPRAEVRWWAEAVDDQEAVLATLGSRELPLLATLPLPAPAAQLAPPTSPPPATPPPEGVAAEPTAPPQERPPLRPVAYGLAGGAVLALGGGAVFGLESRSIDSRLASLPKGPQGQVTGMTERQAYSLNAQSATEATVANVLFGVGAAAAAAGLGIWVYGALAPGPAGGGASVTLAPTLGGLVVAGVMP
jgi:hypothetical protein